MSPAFAQGTTSYTAVVPYETTDIQVDARPSHAKGKVESITGNTNLQIGENTITVTVAAENGAKAEYKIAVTREGTPSANDPGAAEPGITDPDEESRLEEYESRNKRLEKEYKKLDEKYQSEKSFARRTIAILAFVVIVLAIVCVNLLISLKHRNSGLDDFDDDGDEDEWLEEEPGLSKKAEETEVPKKPGKPGAEKTAEKTKPAEAVDEPADTESGSTFHKTRKPERRGNQERLRAPEKKKTDIEVIDFNDF